MNKTDLQKKIADTNLLHIANDLEIIAEVGQNHQGNIENALRYIEKFTKLGATSIKFQARSNKNLFDSSRYNLIYDSPNAFGLTYGQHREKLEFKEKEFELIKKATHDSNSKFCCTPFDEQSLDMLIRLNVDMIKVASFDMGNLPFLTKIGKTKKPIVISTGGAGMEVIIDSLKAIDYGQKIFVLHCTSEYPCTADKVNLSMIPILSKQFPKYNIGLSDHFNGILTGPLARILGAVAFEKHVTFDRSLKGSDHKFSLEPDGFRKFVRDIKRTEILYSRKDTKSIGNEDVFERLGKSCVASQDLKSGENIKLEHITGKIFDKQKIPIRECKKLIGKTLNQSIKKGEEFKYEFTDEIR